MIKAFADLKLGGKAGAVDRVFPITEFDRVVGSHEGAIEDRGVLPIGAYNDDLVLGIHSQPVGRDIGPEGFARGRRGSDLAETVHPQLAIAGVFVLQLKIVGHCLFGKPLLFPVLHGLLFFLLADFLGDALGLFKLGQAALDLRICDEGVEF